MSDKTTINWRTLPAGRALDRVIAERLGYTFDVSTIYLTGAGTRFTSTAIKTPDGTVLYDDDNSALT